MSALSSKSMEWQTPPWLVKKCRLALGGSITLDAASVEANPTGAWEVITKEDDALVQSWRGWLDQHGSVNKEPTLFLNPPGEKTGQLIRKFWRKWNEESRLFHASVWVDFNVDHLRFLQRVPADCLIIPRKRMAFVDPVTGEEKRGAQAGGWIYFRGYSKSLSTLFPEPEFLTMRGEP